MTPYETAMRMMRQRDMTVSDPDFIVAYLREEIKKAPGENGLYLSPHPYDQLRACSITMNKLGQAMFSAFRDVVIPRAIQMNHPAA